MNVRGEKFQRVRSEYLPNQKPKLIESHVAPLRPAKGTAVAAAYAYDETNY